MTALEIYRECESLDRKITRIQERIERRRALATSCTARPLSADGGSSGPRDASGKMLDYVADIEALESEQRKQAAAREITRACCVYLGDLLPDNLAGVALRHYLEHKSYRVIADEMGYSMAHIKRLKGSADEALAGIEITYWDREHVPVCSFKGR